MYNCLKEKRLQKKYTQSELAKRSKVSRTTISSIEAGQLKYIQSDTMLKLAIALGEDVSDIFFKDTVVLTQRNI